MTFQGNGPLEGGNVSAGGGGGMRIGGKGLSLGGVAIVVVVGLLMGSSRALNAALGPLDYRVPAGLDVPLGAVVALRVS